MANEKKITKREALTLIVTLIANSAATEAEKAIVNDFVENEISLLDRKAAKRSATASEGMSANKEKVLEILTAAGKAITISDILKADSSFAASVGFSNQKVTAILRVLREEGRVKRTVVKKVSYYEIGAESAEESAE